MTSMLAMLVAIGAFGVCYLRLFLALALAGMAYPIPLMSPGCSSLIGCRSLLLDFAASGTPSPP